MLRALIQPSAAFVLMSRVCQCSDLSPSPPGQAGLCTELAAQGAATVIPTTPGNGDRRCLLFLSSLRRHPSAQLDFSMRPCRQYCFWIILCDQWRVHRCLWFFENRGDDMSTRVFCVYIYIIYIHNFSRVNHGEGEWGSMCDVVRGVKVQQLAAGVVYTYLYLSVPCTMLDVCGGCHCQCQHFRLCKLERRDVRFRDSGCLVRHFSWM